MLSPLCALRAAAATMLRRSLPGTGRRSQRQFRRQGLRRLQKRRTPTAEPDLVDEAIMLHISGAPLRLIALEMLSATWRIKSSIPQKRITAARLPRQTIPNRP